MIDDDCDFTELRALYYIQKSRDDFFKAKQRWSNMTALKVEK